MADQRLKRTRAAILATLFLVLQFQSLCGRALLQGWPQIFSGRLPFGRWLEGMPKRVRRRERQYHRVSGERQGEVASADSKAKSPRVRDGHEIITKEAPLHRLNAKSCAAVGAFAPVNWIVAHIRHRTASVESNGRQ